MCNEAITAVHKNRIGDGAAKRVLFYLADAATAHADEDWTCFPAVGTIAADLEVSLKTVERALEWLDEHNWVRCIRLRYKAGDRKGQYRGYRFRLNRRRIMDGYAKWLAEQAASRVQASQLDPPDWDEVEEEPSVKMSDGPADSLSGAIRQNGPEPSVKMSDQEPKLEPLLEPTTRVGAREADGAEEARVDAAFDRTFSAYPESGRTYRSHRERQARPAFLAEVELQAAKRGVGRGDAAELIASAVEVASRDKRMLGASGSAKAFHDWLRSGLYDEGLSTVSATGKASATRTAFAGPVEVRAAVIAAHGEGFATSYLDPAGWDAAARAVLPRGSIARDRLRTALPTFKTLGVSIAPITTTATAASTGN